MNFKKRKNQQCSLRQKLPFLYEELYSTFNFFAEKVTVIPMPISLTKSKRI